MKHLRKTIVAALAIAVIGVTALTALAAKPKAGTTYEGDGVVAKMGRDRDAIKKIVTQGTTDKYVVRDVAVTNGRFATQIFGGSGLDPVFQIQGEFTSSRKATGFYVTPLASGDTRYQFTLKPR